MFKHKMSIIDPGMSNMSQVLTLQNIALTTLTTILNNSHDIWLPRKNLDSFWEVEQTTRVCKSDGSCLPLQSVLTQALNPQRADDTSMEKVIKWKAYTSSSMSFLWIELDFSILEYFFILTQWK